MEIISREEARNKGLHRYFTGIPCKRGHISERRVGSTYCLECAEAPTEEKRNAIKIYGVGYNSLLRGEEGFSSKPINGIRREYDHWRRMLQRSYDPKWKALHTTYDDCTVSEDWHDYQNFALWYNTNPFKDITWDLDKDLIIYGNKQYGPNTCVFLPEEVNKAIVIRGRVSRWHKRDEIYEFNCNGTYLGRSLDHLKFQDQWIDFKLNHIRQLADKHKDRLDPLAYDSLLNFKVGVIDEKGTVARLP